MAENLPNPSTRKEMFLASAAGASVDTPAPITREEIFLDAIANNSGGGGEGGTTNYNQLTNKPKINGTELSGNKSLDDIGVTSAITEEVAKIVADAPEDFDTLKEMSDWISDHEDSAAAMNSAIQANTAAISGKVDKVSGKQLSTNDYTNAEKTKLAGLENYDDSAVKSQIGNLVDKGAKNLLKITATSQTINDVTFTVNDDGSITADSSGAASTGLVVLAVGTNLYQAGQYTLSGCPSGGSDTTYRLDIVDYTTGSPVVVAVDTGSGVSFVLNDRPTYRVRIRIASGQIIKSLTFRPMLCTAEDYEASPEFVPYAMSNRELTESVNFYSSIKLVAHTSAQGNTSLAYDTNVNDFNQGEVGDRASGVYLIVCTNWSTSPAVYVGLVSFSGGIANTFAKTDVVSGFSPTINVVKNATNATISISGASKISIYTLM